MRGIIINKDVEEYEYDVWKGFSARQLIFGGAAVAAAVSIILFAYVVCYMPIQAAVYLGIPVGVVIALTGFLKVDDMNLTEYAKEMWRLTFCRPLAWESEEFGNEACKQEEKSSRLKKETEELEAACRKEEKKATGRKATPVEGKKEKKNKLRSIGGFKKK